LSRRSGRVVEEPTCAECPGGTGATAGALRRAATRSSAQPADLRPPDPLPREIASESGSHERMPPFRGMYAGVGVGSVGGQPQPVPCGELGAFPAPTTKGRK
jgi:hypothetical protein